MFGRLVPRGSLRRVVAANTISQMIGRAVSTVMMTVVSLLIAQQFGPNGYGDFVKITTYVGFFYLFGDFGLNAIYIQRAVAAKETDQQVRQWQQLFGLRLIMSGALVVLAFAILLILPRGNSQGYTDFVRFGIMVFTPVILFQMTTTTTNALFQKVLRYDYATIAQNAGSVVMFLVAIVLLRQTQVSGALLGIAAIFAGSVVTSVVALLLVRSVHGAVRPLFHVKRMFPDLIQAFPLGLTLIFNLVYFHSDSVVLTLTRSTSEVGIYGLAYKVFELPLVFPLFFMNAVYPLLLKAGQASRKTPGVMFWQSLQFLFASSLVITTVLWFGAPLVSFIRPDFASSIAPLRILVLGLPVFFVSSLFMWMLIAQKQQWRLLIIHAFAMIGNIGCNIFLIPVYGYMAAAWITISSELFILMVSGFFVFRMLRGPSHLT